VKESITIVEPTLSNKKKGWPWEHTGALYNIDVGKDWPRLTIIMPSYNQGVFIEESIRSVILQDYSNYEFMIFDAGSTDNTLDIIKKYENWISYWESEKDRGQSHAINKGFCRATGEYVAWLNSDDLYYPGALFEIAKAIKANPAAGMIYGTGSKIDIDSQIILEIPYRSYNKKLLSTRFYILQQSSFIKRSVIGEESMDMIIVGLRSGGNISDLIDKIVDNVKEASFLNKELIASVTSYVIFITIVAIVISPVLFALSFNLMEIIQSLGEKLSTASSYGSLSISFGGNKINPNDFILFSQISIAIIAGISSMIIAELREGSIKAGIRYLLMYIPIALGIYNIMLLLFTSVFGTLV